MNVFSVIDAINAKANAENITRQQIADASGVPLSTVNRVLRKENDNPGMQNILDIAGAVGYNFDNPRLPDAAKEDPHVRHIISMYEKQIADMRRDHNRERSEKNRWIMTLAIIIGVLGAGIITILLIDILNPTVGWFRREMYQYSGATSFNDALLSVGRWLGWNV